MAQHDGIWDSGSAIPKELQAEHASPILPPKVAAPAAANPALESNGNASNPHAATKTTAEILSYQDKWIGWPGPVWCHCHQRFEDKEEAAKDDGFMLPVDLNKSGFGLKLHRCSCEHGDRSGRMESYEPYLKAMQRHLEPITHSLARLEQRVEHLFKHPQNSGAHTVNGTADPIQDKQQQQPE